MTKHTTTRRDFIARSSAAAAAASLARGAALAAVEEHGIPQRPIPSTGEMLPVIGLGSSKVVEQIAQNGTDPLLGVLRALVAHGGKLVDTWPRDPANDAAFGSVISEPDLKDELFITTKVDQVGKEAGIRQFRDAQRNYRREVLDLVQIFSLTDLDTHWPSLKEWKAEGSARYIGVTVAQDSLHDELEAFMRRERPDFVQMNYSITERAVEDRLLPFAADRGVAVLAQVHRVQVRLEDRRLRHARLEGEGQRGLAKLPVPCAVMIQGNVLDQLLRERAPALHDLSPAQVDPERPPDGVKVDSAVLEEAVVLDRQHGRDQVTRDGVEPHGLATMARSVVCSVWTTGNRPSSSHISPSQFHIGATTRSTPLDSWMSRTLR